MTHRPSNNPYRPMHICSLLYILFMFMTMPGLRMDINVTLPWAVTLIILHANNDKTMTYMTKLGQNRLPQMKTKA